MDTLREMFDDFYDLVKPRVFRLTETDPKKAHELFRRFCGVLSTTHLDRLVLDNSSNLALPPFELSNAAGLNKDGKFHPRVLRYLGFDRVVVGTVTRDPWNGNPRPTTKRYSETESMVNWEGLPGEGVERVAERMESYGNHGVLITINFMSTPGKQGDELLRDLEGTVIATRDLPFVDRYELNISCPNTHGKNREIDTRGENLRMLDSMLYVIENQAYFYQDIDLKVSPDSTQDDVNDTADVVRSHRVRGFTTTNTTTNHDRRYIDVSPEVEGKKVGGASGNAVYEDSLRVQKLYEERRNGTEEDWKITACGGINSSERVRERLEAGASGIQLYTPLVFSGPRILRELRKYRE